jgi:hypothetical protein
MKVRLKGLGLSKRLDHVPATCDQKLKADRISGSFNTEGTHPANSRQIKQDYPRRGGECPERNGHHVT